MGAWGHGYFENDTAFDFMADIEESNNPKQIIENALDTAIESDYLDSDEGDAVIIAAIYIDRYINGTKYSSEDSDEPLDVDTFPDRNPNINLQDLKQKAIEALNKVINDESELNELWAENEEDYPDCRKGVEVLIQRLTR